MAKVSTEDVEAQLTEMQAPSDMKDELMSRLNKIIEEEKEARAAADKPPKYRHLVFGVSSNFDPETPLFVVKIEEGDDHNEAYDNLIAAVRAHNAEQKDKKRGKRVEIESFGDAIQNLPPKKASDNGVKIVERGPVIGIAVSTNDLPDPPPASE